MAIKDPLAHINPHTVGYGKSGSGAYKKDDHYSRDKGVEDVSRDVMLPARRSLETANLSKENLDVIMDKLGEIVGNKSSKYSKLTRENREHFRHRLEQERQHGRLSDADIKDAWKIWKNFDS